MTTDYMDRESSKKKYLAPLVVIMLCAVAVTGAAYAYNTSVEGYGDIEGKYAFIDLYADDDCGSATAKFTGNASSFKVYTQTVKTVGADGTESSTYNAYVETGKLEFSAYVMVKTSLGTNEDPQYFALSGASFVYTAPENSGTIVVDNQTSGKGDLDTEIVFYEKNGTTDAYDVPVTKLKGNTAYKVVITLPVTGDKSKTADASDNYPFGEYTSAQEVLDAVDAFNKQYSYELVISIGVTETEAPTQTD